MALPGTGAPDEAVRRPGRSDDSHAPIAQRVKDPALSRRADDGVRSGVSPIFWPILWPILSGASTTRITYRRES